MNKVFVLFFILVAPHLLLAQSASSNSCSCTDLLNQLISKVESNYAGYVHKVLDKKDNSSYIQLKNNLIAEAILTSNKDCYDVLSKFLKYFNDGHLFIIEFPENTPQQSDSLQKLINSVTLTETKIKGSKKSGTPRRNMAR
ncbi:MAG: hypothetical protein ABI761_12380 [Saprospiraceae bacterium]